MLMAAAPSFPSDDHQGGRWFARPGMSRVLLIADDPQHIAAHLSDAEACGWGVRIAKSAEEAVETDWAGWAPDVALFDILLPRAELYRAFGAVRTIFGAPIAVVVDRDDMITATVRGDRGVVPLGRAGAINELRHLARTAVAGSVLTAGPLSLSLASRVARIGTRALMLSDDEAATLCCLMSSAGEAVSRRTLVAAIGGLGFDLDPRVVDIHVVRLMLAIGEDAGVRIARTADRAGYVLHVAGGSAAG
jgi:DNA-binding response OmpR family regulator